jgi:hypothetical protein
VLAQVQQTVLAQVAARICGGNPEASRVPMELRQAVVLVSMETMAVMVFQAAVALVEML